jgi:hypothetical protein
LRRTVADFEENIRSYVGQTVVSQTSLMAYVLAVPLTPLIRALFRISPQMWIEFEKISGYDSNA